MKKVSKFKYGNTPINELEKEKLLECTEAMWDEKNLKIKELETEIKVYQDMLKSPHRIWSDFGNNAFSIIFYCFLLLSIGYLFGVK